MTEQTLIENTQEEMWATVELMGHGQTAGRVTKPSEWGGYYESMFRLMIMAITAQSFMAWLLSMP